MEGLLCFSLVRIYKSKEGKELICCDHEFEALMQAVTAGAEGR